MQHLKEQFATQKHQTSICFYSSFNFHIASAAPPRRPAPRTTAGRAVAGQIRDAPRRRRRIQHGSCSAVAWGRLGVVGGRGRRNGKPGTAPGAGRAGDGRSDSVQGGRRAAGVATAREGAAAIARPTMREGAVGGGPVMAGGTHVGREERRGGEYRYESEEEEKNEKGGARSIGHPALSITIYFIDQKI